jgi:two-component system phosphate regulon response regulator OmpR
VAKILVVDDDSRLRELLRRYLVDQGFEVKTVANAGDMDRALHEEHFRLIVLDLMLPGEDGLAICRRLRGGGESIPIIMLTAKGDDVDRIVGLELGADDYMPKPFNPRELVARIHTVLRRVRPEPAGAPTVEAKTVDFGPFQLDLGRRLLTRNGRTVALTTAEFALLKTFATHPRRVLSREVLLQLSRGREYQAFDRSADVQVARLRRLIETDLGDPRYIQTVWGEGYVFVPDGGVP